MQFDSGKKNDAMYPQMNKYYYLFIDILTNIWVSVFSFVKCKK